MKKKFKIIAELGSVHDGKFNIAKKLIAFAANSGANYIKFQSFVANKLVTISASLGIVLSACYGLWLSRRIIFGNVTNNKLLEITDLNRIEKLYFIPLIVFTFSGEVFFLPL